MDEPTFVEWWPCSCCSRATSTRAQQDQIGREVRTVGPTNGNRVHLARLALTSLLAGVRSQARWVAGYPEFAKLWAGESVSLLETAIRSLALPLMTICTPARGCFRGGVAQAPLASWSAPWSIGVAVARASSQPTWARSALLAQIAGPNLGASPTRARIRGWSPFGWRVVPYRDFRGALSFWGVCLMRKPNVDPAALEDLLIRVFGRVHEGVSTQVYRLRRGPETFYLRMAESAATTVAREVSS